VLVGGAGKNKVQAKGNLEGGRGETQPKKGPTTPRLLGVESGGELKPSHGGDVEKNKRGKKK